MANNTPQDNGRLVGGGVLIGLGLLFLAGQIFDMGALMSTLWPFFIIVPGLAFLAGAAMGDKKSSGLAVPGAMITGTGAILLYQNLTGHWESWAYMWTLYPVFLGMAFNFMSNRTGDNNLAKVARGFITWGLAGLVGLGALFELFIFGSLGWLGSIAVPGAMIAAGAYLLMRNRSGGFSSPLADVSSKAKRISSSRLDRGPSADINPELKRKIEDALADEEEQTI
ncbi:MAG: hypothetical protein U0694_21570 [Anaerolineae bacterium]